MKKIIYFLSISLLFSCCKDDDEKNDYRDIFVGKYFCHQTGKTMCNGQIIYYIDTSFVISVEKYRDSMINILDDTLKISIDGKFGGGYNPTPNYRFFEGCFKNDSIIFLTNVGGIACNTSSNYKGKKQ